MSENFRTIFFTVVAVTLLAGFGAGLLLIVPASPQRDQLFDALLSVFKAGNVGIMGLLVAGRWSKGK